ncbi:MAG: hypothetical protein ACRDV4_03570 [Acidimicrobiales bacterium]
MVGRELEARSFRRLKGELMLVVSLPDGSPGTLAAVSTDIFGEAAPTTEHEAVRLVLSLEGVRRLRVLVEAKSRGPKSRGTRRHAT